MDRFAITVVGLLLGAVLGWLTIYGLVTSSTSTDGSPVDADTASIEYGTTADD